MQNINWLYICFYKDLGQKDFGHVTCPTCGMVYTKAQPDDEAEHIRHHKRFVSGLRFTVSNVQQLDQFSITLLLKVLIFRLLRNYSTHCRILISQTGVAKTKTLQKLRPKACLS